MQQIINILLCMSTVIFSCGQTKNPPAEKDNTISGQPSAELINTEGNTIDTRFNLQQNRSR